MKTLPRISTELFGAIVLLMLMANDRVETTRLAQWTSATWVSGQRVAAAEIRLPGIPAIQPAPPEERNRRVPGERSPQAWRHEEYALLMPTGREILERIRKEEDRLLLGNQESGRSIALRRSLPTTQIVS